MLRTFRKLFEPEARDALDASLRAYAGRLGELRDLQVLTEVLAEHCTGELAGWVAGELQSELAAAWQQLERELDADEYHHLADQLAAVILTVPGTTHEGKVDVGKRARRAAKKARRRLAEAGDDPDRLHDARKAAKRARYAAEATDHKRRAGRFKALQDVLGTHHDLVVAADWIEVASVPDGLREEATRLVARLRADAEQARSRAVL